ncbi:MAG: uroporphyrinogen-III C-methyltransferase [Dehalococcoidia bacterium]
MDSTPRGKVYLVGAGPGDPQLITIKALKCIGAADVIVYDRLANDRFLEEARPDVEKIYVGKSSQGHTMSQSEINDLLVSKAKEGKAVVRLKGGDPFVFGRGGEEAEALQAQGLPFEIVPGVTAAIAVPAYAGIPVTHRAHASSVAIITGHEDPTKGESSIAWDKLATGADTLVFLMGMQNLPQIVEQLLANGRPPTTLVALIREGAGPRQRTIVGTLADIAAKAAEDDFTPPAVVVVGSVVQLRSKLRWYDNQPLFGKRVLVTRSRHQASALSELLAQKGAEPIEMPVIEIEAMADYQELDKALASLSSYAWLIFTSVNGVEAFFARLLKLGLDARELKGAGICAIGPATVQALKQHGLLVDYMPEEYVSESIIKGFADMDLQSKRVLLPRAEKARPELVEGLRSLGARVDEIPVYRTVQPAQTSSQGKRLLMNGEVDITTFTSSSTVHNLVSSLGKNWQVVNNTVVACIGPVTADTATAAGLRVDVMAKEHTIPGLVQAIVEQYEQIGQA